MSQIEAKAKPFLSKMIRGEEVELNGGEQTALATWACARAMVARFQHHHPSPVPVDWLRHLYRYQTPPDGWNVWGVSYTGSQPLFYAGADAYLEDPAFQTGSGISAVLVIGFLALKMLGVPGSPTDRPRSNLSEFWPIVRDPEQWPPVAHVRDDDGLNALFEARVSFFRPKP